MAFKKFPVYFIPGMAAGKEIFGNISLPQEKYEIHVLEWLIPENGESLKEYAKRMASRITEPNAILIGVSFGGVVAQEMSLLLDLKKIIIISSVKTRHELPRRMRWSSATGLYKLIPTSLVLSVEDLTKFAVGPKSRKRLRMYQKYLHVRNKQYLDWALEKMITWDRIEKLQDVIHIQGDRDPVFPVKYMDNYISVSGGTHIMILNKASEITQKIREIIEQ